MIIFRNTFLLALAFACCTFFVGCGDDDGETSFNEADLVATWTLSSADLEFSINGQSLSQWLQQEGGFSAAEAQVIAQGVEDLLDDEFPEGATIQFNSDNTYEANFGGDIEEGTWTLSSDGRTLTLNPDDDPEDQQITITRLDGNSLSVLISETDVFDLDDDGDEDDELSIDATLNFTK